MMASHPPFYPLHPAIHHNPLDIAIKSKIRLKTLYEYIKMLWILRRTFKKLQPDILISFIDTMNLFTIIASRGLGIPVIVSERSNPFLYKIAWIWEFLRPLLYPFADVTVFQTKGIGSYFSKQIQAKSAVIHNPVVLLPRLVNEKLSFQKPFILAVGRFTEEKCFDLLINAFSQIAPRFPDWHLVIAGDGPLRELLQNLIIQCHLENKVTLPGRIKDINSLYDQASLFILSSRFEGFPNVLCEAMANGLPVIATDCSFGPRDIIRDGIDGVLIPVNDVNALANAIEKTIENEQLLKQFAARGPEILDRFNVERVMSEWEKIIYSVLK